MAENKKIELVINDWAEADECLKDIKQADIRLVNAQNEYNAAVDKLNEKHQLTDKKDYIAERKAALQKFCKKNRKAFNGENRKELNNGIVGFRKTPAKLVMLKGWTDEKSIQVIRKLKKYVGKFLKITTTLDKTAIKKEALPDKELAKIGFELTEGENFFIE